MMSQKKRSFPSFSFMPNTIKSSRCQLAIDRALYPHLSAKDKAKGFPPVKKTHSAPCSATSSAKDSMDASASGRLRGGTGSIKAPDDFQGNERCSDEGVKNNEEGLQRQLTLLGSKQNSVKGGNSSKGFKPTLSGKFRLLLMA